MGGAAKTVKGQEPLMGEEKWRELDLFNLAMRR